jgi:hypothetical protein
MATDSGAATFPGPAKLTVASRTTTSISLDWQPTRGAIAYGIWRGGRRVAIVYRTAYTFTGFTCGTNHTVAVRARYRGDHSSPLRWLHVSTRDCPPPVDPPPVDPPPVDPPPVDPPPVDPPPTPDPPPVSAATVFVSTGGSDSAPCSQSQPCKSFDRAYKVAHPGDTVEVAGGSYSSQTINVDSSKTSTDDVVFVPASDASVHAGSVDVYGSHVEFRDMTFGWKTYLGASDITFRNVSADWIGISSSSNVSVIGGEVYPGDDFLTGCTQSNNTCDYDPLISESPGSKVAPKNVLIDGVHFHGWLRPAGTDFHTECLQVGAGETVTIQNSVFDHCATHDIFIRSWGNINGGVHNLKNWLIQNNVFEETQDGYYVMQFVGDLNRAGCVGNEIRYNSAAQGFLADQCDVGFVGNIAPRASYSCGGSYFRHNVWFSDFSTPAHCGSTDIAVNGGDPGFVDMAAGNLRLKATSVAVGAGDPAEYPATDADGDARSDGHPDAGAFELG